MSPYFRLQSGTQPERVALARIRTCWLGAALPSCWFSTWRWMGPHTSRAAVACAVVSRAVVVSPSSMASPSNEAVRAVRLAGVRFPRRSCCVAEVGGRVATTLRLVTVDERRSTLVTRAPSA